MTLTDINSILRKTLLTVDRRWHGFGPVFLGAFAVITMVAGCESPSASSATALRGTAPASSAATKSPGTVAPAPETPAHPDEGSGRLSELITIREGDVLKISFPGAPQIDITQQVRSDGVVTLDTVGEVKVTGLSPKELEKTLSKMYESQLVSNEVVVAIINSSFDVYVTGSVLRPGKISATKPITAFQAIMEAGYDPINSNLEKVVLIREVGRAKYTYIPLNLQLVLEGKATEPYYLKPSDTLQVPKKITIF
jgi:polysaccharide biosynthesis/export protein